MFIKKKNKTIYDYFPDLWIYKNYTLENIESTLRLICFDISPESIALQVWLVNKRDELLNKT